MDRYNLCLCQGDRRSPIVTNIEVGVKSELWSELQRTAQEPGTGWSGQRGRCPEEAQRERAWGERAACWEGSELPGQGGLAGL